MALLVAAIALVATPVAVHVMSEPGSEISLFLGLLKYKKAAQSPPPSDEGAPAPSDYVLPRDIDLLLDTVNPILDGTINVTLLHRTRGNFLRIGGTNIAKVQAAARQLDGNPLELAANFEKRSLDIEGHIDCYVEIEYAGRVFAVATREFGIDRYRLSVTALKQATLKLRPHGLQ